MPSKVFLLTVLGIALYKSSNWSARPVRYSLILLNISFVLSSESPLLKPARVLSTSACKVFIDLSAAVK